MRVAMGLAINEIDREQRAIEFYELLSSFDFMSSTPTLSTRHAAAAAVQLLSHHGRRRPRRIYSAIKDNALLSKYAGGLATTGRGCAAWARISRDQRQVAGRRALPEGRQRHAVAVNQGGKRKGAVCAYLETWHVDVEEFLDLRKNTATTAAAPTT